MEEVAVLLYVPVSRVYGRTRKTIFKAIPRLPTQEILAVPRGGHHGLVGVSKHGGVSLSKIGPSVCNIDADEFTVVVAR
ncbi:MAG: hypothetical protein DMG55_07050 [Acidobacteria bacterium]|nr:MAG: hypothetical protein DMG55_07050 [Acidobacteriota bacterium]